MEVQAGAVQPLLDEDEVPGILLVHEQFHSRAERLALRHATSFRTAEARCHGHQGWMKVFGDDLSMLRHLWIGALRIVPAWVAGTHPVQRNTASRTDQSARSCICFE